eukprot:939732-Pyramimonas_sp.AAC.1
MLTPYNAKTLHARAPCPSCMSSSLSRMTYLPSASLTRDSLFIRLCKLITSILQPQASLGDPSRSAWGNNSQTTRPQEQGTHFFYSPSLATQLRRTTSSVLSPT